MDCQPIQMLTLSLYMFSQTITQLRTNNTALTLCSTVLFVAAIRVTNSNHIRHSWINLLKSQRRINNE